MFRIAFFLVSCPIIQNSLKKGNLSYWNRELWSDQTSERVDGRLYFDLSWIPVPYLFGLNDGDYFSFWSAPRKPPLKSFPISPTRASTAVTKPLHHRPWIVQVPQWGVETLLRQNLNFTHFLLPPFPMAIFNRLRLVLLNSQVSFSSLPPPLPNFS